MGSVLEEGSVICRSHGVGMCLFGFGGGSPPDLKITVSPDDRASNLLSNGPIESFWGALWLGIQPFLCFKVECRKMELQQLFVVGESLLNGKHKP